MRLDSLKHLVRAVAAMLDGDRLVVFGSASLLASFPELGDLEGSSLLQTYDMAATKCLVGRNKDREQLQYLLNADYLSPRKLKNRVAEIELSPQMIVKSHRFLDDFLG
jgi:hypothetical protein